MINKICGNVFRWIFFGVLISFVPIGLTYIFNLIVEIETDLTVFLPDFLLGILAVLGNIINNVIDSDKKIVSSIKIFICCIDGLLAVICMVFYFGLFNFDFLSRTIVSRISDNKPILHIILKISCGVLVFNVIAGIIIEIYAIMKTKNRSNC